MSWKPGKDGQGQHESLRDYLHRMARKRERERAQGTDADGWYNDRKGRYTLIVGRKPGGKLVERVYIDDVIDELIRETQR